MLQPSRPTWLHPGTPHEGHWVARRFSSCSSNCPIPQSKKNNTAVIEQFVKPLRHIQVTTDANIQGNEELIQYVETEERDALSSFATQIMNVMRLAPNSLNNRQSIALNTGDQPLLS